MPTPLRSLGLVFSGIHRFNTGEVGLAFIPLGLGLLSSLIFVPIFNKPYLRARTKAGKPVPEERLRMATLSCPCMVIGL